MSFQSLLWFFPIAVTLHNAEEAIWFPEWTKRTSRWPAPVEPGVFRFAAVVFTIVAFAVTWLSARSGKQTVWTYLAFGYMVAVIANALVPHIALTLAMRRYMPGVVTGAFLNLPVLSLLVVLALREGYVSGFKAAAYSIGVAAVLLLFGGSWLIARTLTGPLSALGDVARRLPQRPQRHERPGQMWPRDAILARTRDRPPEE